MKEATGELNMTVVTLVAVAAIGAIFYLVVWPLIQTSIVTQSCRSTFGPGWSAQKTDTELDGESNAKVYQWKCCTKGDNSSCKYINYGMKNEEQKPDNEG